MSIKLTLKELQKGLEKSNPNSKVKIKEFRHAPKAGGHVIKGKDLEDLLKE